MNVALTIRKVSGEIEYLDCLDLHDASFMASLNVEAGNQALSISMNGQITHDETAVRRLTRELAIY